MAHGTTMKLWGNIKLENQGGCICTVAGIWVLLGKVSHKNKQEQACQVAIKAEHYNRGPRIMHVVGDVEFHTTPTCMGEIWHFHLDPFSLRASVMIKVRRCLAS